MTQTTDNEHTQDFHVMCACLPSSLDDVHNNMAVMESAFPQAKESQADLLIFGEAFLQGFEAMTFDYKNDVQKAIFLKGVEITTIRTWAKKHDLAIGFGFFENQAGGIYSSYLVIDREGDVQGHYRRVSKGWKQSHACADYREGNQFTTFTLDGRSFTILLCGDFWEDDLLLPIIDRDEMTDYYLWPVHCDYPTEEWNRVSLEVYRQRTEILAKPVIFVNNFIEEEGRAKGGAYLWRQGKELTGLAYGEPGMLVVNLEG